MTTEQFKKLPIPPGWKRELVSRYPEGVESREITQPAAVPADRDLTGEVLALSDRNRDAVLLWLATSTQHRGALAAALDAMRPYLTAPEGDQE